METFGCRRYLSFDVGSRRLLRGARPGNSFGAGLVGGAAIERRLGIVFEPELDHSGGLFARQFGGENKRKIDSGCYAAAGKAIAIADDTRINPLCAELGQILAPQPMAGRFVAHNQSGCAEQNRTVANRGDIARAGTLPAQEVERRVILKLAEDPRATRHAEHLKLRTRIECDGGIDGETDIGPDRLHRLPGKMHFGARHTAQNLCRPHEV